MRRVGRNSFTEIYFAGCNPELCRDQRRLCDDRLAAAADRRGALAREDGGKGADPLPDQHRAARRPHLGQRLFPERAGGRAGQVAGMLRALSRRVRLDGREARALQAAGPGQRVSGRPSRLRRPARADRHLHRRADPPCRRPHLQHHPPSRPHRAADLGPRAGRGGRLHRRQRLPQMPLVAAGMRPVGVARGAAEHRGARRRDASCPATASPAARPI